MKSLFRTYPTPAHSGCKPKDTPNTAGVALNRFIRQASSLMLLALTLGFLSFRLYLGEFTWFDALIPAVILMSWPLLEWWIHVHLLHYRPRRIFGRRIDFLLPQTHRWHHADPWNLDRVFIPLHIFPLLLPLLIPVVFWLAPSAAMACTILAAYFAFALHYEWVHYLAHIRWCPPLGYYQRRVREHRLHHFRNERRWWGVSMGLGDRLLGTAPEATETPLSANTADIVGAAEQHLPTR